MPATSPPDPPLRIFAATMRAVLGPDERPAPDGIEPPLAPKETEEITVELERPQFDGPQPSTAQPAEPALFLLSRGRHRMW